MSNGFRFPENAILRLMNKKTIRFLLLSAAVIFTANLILFSYGPGLILPLLGAVSFLVAIGGFGFFIVWKFEDRRPGDPGGGGAGAAGDRGVFLPDLLSRNPHSVHHSGILRGGGSPLADPAAGSGLAPGKRARVEAFLSPGRCPNSRFSFFPCFTRRCRRHSTIPWSIIWAFPICTCKAAASSPRRNLFLPTRSSITRSPLIPAVFLGEVVPRLFHFLLGALFHSGRCR